MRSSFSSGFCLLLAALLMASCAKEGPTGPTGPAGPSLPGTISGHVKLYDKYGSQVTTNLSKVALYINGSSTAIYPDDAGYYLISKIGTVSLTTGSYAITAVDSGYGTTIKNNIQLVSGALNVDMRLSANPDSFITGFQAYHNTGSANDSLVLHVSADTRQRNCILLGYTSPQVNGQPTNYIWSKVVSISPTAPVVTYVLPGQDLTDLGLASGSKIYFAAYSYVIGDVSVYEDFGTGRSVYNAVNSNAIIDSAIVP